MRFLSVFLRFSVALSVLSSSPLVSAQDDAGSASPANDAPEPTPVAAPAQLPAPAPKTSAASAPAVTPTSMPEATSSPPPTPTGFAFGSYGRVRAASDLRGHSGQITNIVAFGTRYDLGNYAELELRREDHPGDVQLRIVSTLGFQGDFFHLPSRAASTRPNRDQESVCRSRGCAAGRSRLAVGGLPNGSL